MSFPDITAEINDMFADLVVTDTNDVMQALYQESPDTYLLKPSQKDTERGRISTLSEMFLEWYLFDSNDKKDIKTYYQLWNLSENRSGKVCGQRKKCLPLRSEIYFNV